MKKLLSACLLSTALLAGCSSEEEGSADSEACEHLQGGAAANVTATATASGAPAVSNDHKRYDISLVDVQGGKGGAVSFAASEATDYVFFVDQDVPFAITSSSGQAVELEESAKSSTECTDIKGRHVAPLQVGTYTLTFGPTTGASEVSLVVEEAAHEDGAH